MTAGVDHAPVPRVAMAILTTRGTAMDRMLGLLAILRKPSARQPVQKLFDVGLVPLTIVKEVSALGVDLSSVPARDLPPRPKVRGRWVITRLWRTALRNWGQWISAALPAVQEPVLRQRPLGWR
jgi:hypothetical protein